MLSPYLPPRSHRIRGGEAAAVGEESTDVIAVLCVVEDAACGHVKNTSMFFITGPDCRACPASATHKRRDVKLTDF